MITSLIIPLLMTMSHASISDKGFLDGKDQKFLSSNQVQISRPDKLTKLASDKFALSEKKGYIVEALCKKEQDSKETTCTFIRLRGEQ